MAAALFAAPAADSALGYLAEEFWATKPNSQKQLVVYIDQLLKVCADLISIEFKKTNNEDRIDDLLNLEVTLLQLKDVETKNFMAGTYAVGVARERNLTNEEIERTLIARIREKPGQSSLEIEDMCNTVRNCYRAVMFYAQHELKEANKVSGSMKTAKNKVTGLFTHNEKKEKQGGVGIGGMTPVSGGGVTPVNVVEGKGYKRNAEGVNQDNPGTVAGHHEDEGHGGSNPDLHGPCGGSVRMDLSGDQSHYPHHIEPGDMDDKKERMLTDELMDVYNRFIHEQLHLGRNKEHADRQGGSGGHGKGAAVKEGGAVRECEKGSKNVKSGGGLFKIGKSKDIATSS